MNNKELAKEIIEQVQCGASESDVLQLLDDNTSQEKALDIDLVSQRSELLDFKEWWNNLPNESDDKLYMTNETIERFKANCS